MKRITLALAFMTTILSLAPLPVPFASIVNADISAEMPAINVLSPLWKNVYHSSGILLSFAVTTPQSWSEVFPGYSGGILYWRVGTITFVRYSLDGKESENITVDDDQGGLTIGPSSEVFDFSFNLTGLSDGQHNVTVSVFGSYKGEAFNFSRNPIIFFVDTAPLELKVLSPESKVYNITDIPLVVTITEPASWMGYSLDEGDHVTITENTTLKNVSAGSHNLTVFANDTIGNFASSETTFTVAKPETQQPESFPVVPVAAAVAVATCAGLLLYFKKRKGQGYKSD